jgi:hypothetical protein
VLSDGTLKYVYGVGLDYAADTAGYLQVYHTDGLGSIRAVGDGSGTLTQTYQTDPFGGVTQAQGSSAQPSVRRPAARLRELVTTTCSSAN